MNTNNNMPIKKRNSLLDGIKEEHSADFTQDLLNLEFKDSSSSDEGDESISLSLQDAMVPGDEELQLGASASIAEEPSINHDEDEEDDAPPSSTKRDKSITERIQKRTGRVKIITWGLLLLLSLTAILTSHFITRGEDCDEKREEVRTHITISIYSWQRNPRLTPFLFPVWTVCVAGRRVTTRLSRRDTRTGKGPCHSKSPSHIGSMAIAYHGKL